MIIRCIDFETTGIPTEDDPHAIVEIGWCDLHLAEGGNFHQGWNAVLCDPGRPIPHDAMAVHHITDEDVFHATGTVVDLVKEPRPAYFAAHHADYERKFFDGAGAPWICTYKVALRIWPDAPQHKLQFLRYHLGLEVDRERCQPPHRAGPDAYLCAALMARILAEATCSLEDMARWSSGPALLPRVNFGKHYGAKWDAVPTDYLEWVVRQNMDVDVMANARHHLKLRGAL